MITRTVRAAAVTATLAMMAAVGLASPAVAAQPKTGHFGHAYDDKETPFSPDKSIDFDVASVGGKLKVKQFEFYSFSCGTTLTVNKTLPVSSKGKFKFLGNADTPGTAQVRIKVKGKFTSSTKAKVTVVGKDSVYTCEQYSATVKRAP